MKIGDIVERWHKDRHVVLGFPGDGGALVTVRCIVPPPPEAPQWCKVGEVETNLIRRYTVVDENPLDGEWKLGPWGPVPQPFGNDDPKEVEYMGAIDLAFREIYGPEDKMDLLRAFAAGWAAGLKHHDQTDKKK